MPMILIISLLLSRRFLPDLALRTKAIVFPHERPNRAHQYSTAPAYLELSCCDFIFLISSRSAYAGISECFVVATHGPGTEIIIST